MIDISMVYVTCESKDQAQSIAGVVISENLAACANILPEITSVYHWEGELHCDPETLLLLKTRSPLVQQLVQRINELHSYDCPCIVAYPASAGSQPYSDWIRDQTGGNNPLIA